jgi:hypothetical protein
VAHRLGVHRHTVRRWLALYAAGGLAAVLATYIPTGKPVALAPAVLASLKQTLHRLEGVASDGGLATIRREMGHFGVTAVFHVEFEKRAYRQTGRWPKTSVFGAFSLDPTKPSIAHQNSSVFDTPMPTFLFGAHRANPAKTLFGYTI